MSQYSIFQIHGGIGKHIAATAVAKTIKENYPDRKLIIVCAYPELFINLPFVSRVYQLGATQYFYQEYIQNTDSIVFCHEPYYTTEHIHKQLPLIENWCKLYNLKYNGARPALQYNRVQQTIAKTNWARRKPTLIIHTNGGLMSNDAKPYAWTRDMPFEIAQEVTEYYKNKYHVMQLTKLNSPKLEHAEHIYATQDRALTLMEFFSILLNSEKRLLIDSSVQHAAAALNKKSTVLWIGTSPKVFGYPIHDNIVTTVPVDFKLPGSYLFDFDFSGNELEYPFATDSKLFNVSDIIKSIDAQ